jgi:signal transduction histidine kinase
MSLNRSFWNCVVVVLLANFSIVGGLYFCFDRSLSKIANETIENWYQAERNEIAQGNLLSSVARNQALLLSSEFLKAGAVVSQNGLTKPEVLLSFGEPVDWPLLSLKERIIDKGFLKKIVTRKVGESENLSVSFFIYSQSVISFFWISLGLSLLLINLAFAIVLRTQARELALSQSLADLAVQVSHDIRSPLSALNMAVSKMDGVSDDSRALIQKVSQRISQIADDLLKRHQPKITAAHSRPQSSLKELLEQIYTEKKLALGAETGVVLKLDLCEAEAFCDVDRSALARVLSNLLNNSIESLAEDGQVTLALRSHGESRVQILVSDNGKGIPSEVLQKLGKEKISFGKEGRGSGVGLLYAHKVIAKMGGQMTIQSQVGVGTLVTILLPTSRNS